MLKENAFPIMIQIKKTIMFQPIAGFVLISLHLLYVIKVVFCYVTNVNVGFSLQKSHLIYVIKTMFTLCYKVV